MILIADSGATKTHWVALENGAIVKEIYTPGFNPYYYPTDEFERSLDEELKKEIPDSQLQEVFFYGSGISSETNKQIVKTAILKNFPHVKVSTFHDLTGAAVALLGDQNGIACILGTGSNSCHWDGSKIIGSVPSLGFFLGDEGSGTYIGKLFVRDVLIGDADTELTKMFYDENELSFAKTLDRIYKEEHPNRFFAAQTRFLRGQINRPYVYNLVKRAFTDFVNVQLRKYNQVHDLPVSFTGSIAANFQPILEEVLTENHIQLGKVMKEPMSGMIEYHLSHLV